jgi:methionyl-tRNA formyltransferase
MVLDARLGILPRRIRKFMNNGLQDDDFAFLQHIGGLEGAVEKLKQARMLAEEARAEIAAALGDAAPAKKSKKVKKAKKAKAKKTNAPKIEFKAKAVDLSDAEKAVLDMIKRGISKMPNIVEQTGLALWQTKKAANDLKARKLIKLEGHGASAAWKVK